MLHKEHTHRQPKHCLCKVCKGGILCGTPGADTKLQHMFEASKLRQQGAELACRDYIAMKKDGKLVSL